MQPSRPKILLVNDRGDHLKIVESILDRLGAEVEVAGTGIEAIEATADTEFAFVLLDLQLAGTSGFEVAAQLSKEKEGYSAPVIVLTSPEDDPDTVYRGYYAGAIDYLEKPLDADVLQSKAKVFLDMYRQHQALAIEIQERKRAEENLKRAQEQLQLRNDELSEFAHLAAHDLKSPLHTIHGFAHRLYDKIDTAKPERIKEWADLLITGANRMSTMVDGLLEYAKAGLAGSNYEIVDLSAISHHVRDYLECKIMDSGAEVNFAEMPEVYGNRAALTQLLLNLVSNAIKFRGEASPIVNVSATREGEDWQITVSDNGIGIDPKNHDKVFAPLERLHTETEYEGTGLGLAACKKIVDAHQGQVWLKSQLGSGTTFVFTLPASMPAVEPVPV